MSVRSGLIATRGKAGHSLAISSDGENPSLVLAAPVIIESWDKKSGRMSEARSAYTAIKEDAEGLVGEATVATAEGGSCRVVDTWHRLDGGTWRLSRKAEVLAGWDGGFRLRLDLVTTFADGAGYTDLQYFTPHALYDKNDIDGDGLEDFHHTQNQMYRDDRLNSLGVTAYHPRTHLTLSLFRDDPPEFDANPDRPNKELAFLQKTDVGSLGIWNIVGKVSQMCLRASYPFYEGERSHAVNFKTLVPWGAFWPAEQGETVEAAYRIAVTTSPTFAAAMWGAYTTQLHALRPRPVALPATAEELNHYRLDALNRYYIEIDAQDDPKEPAGYVLNCHPQDGIQISNIIQFGFTGQNVLSAYNTMRYGYQMGNGEYVRRARKIVDFFATKAHIPESGMFYNLYNIDSGKFSFWWTGLLLPLAYAEGDELRELMGPLYEFMEHVIVHLKEQQGSYLRCMNEDAEALLRIYEYERDLGHEHPDWIAAGRRYGDFLVRTQEPSGIWTRAYDVRGRSINRPEIWFGRNEYERASSTGTSIPFLVKLAELTGDDRYLTAARKAGKYVHKHFVDEVKYGGGIHDSIYAKGVLIDHESIFYVMVGLLHLYKATGENEFLKGAHDAARITATWTKLWDVPFDPTSTLARYGFRSTGVGGADSASSGYVHPMQIVGVPEMSEIALLTGDRELLEVAEITWHGCNQTVAVPGKDWGYAYPGLQEEGYFVSWWGADDPMFEGTGFGQRGKGEGNKTCFPWIAAVAVSTYWKLMDQFHTTDFSSIRARFAKAHSQ